MTGALLEKGPRDTGTEGGQYEDRHTQREGGPTKLEAETGMTAYKPPRMPTTPRS